MRFSSCLSAIALTLTLSAVPAQALMITHTQPRKMENTAFTRLGEFFGLHPVDPTRVVIFSNPKAHAGLFFEAELDAPISKIPAGSSALLEIFIKDDQAPRKFNFAIPETKPEAKSKARALYLGLTDAPFSDMSSNKDAKSKVDILAWKISIVDRDGKVLASSASPMWQY
jgi:hypothetical protein